MARVRRLAVLLVLAGWGWLAAAPTAAALALPPEAMCAAEIAQAERAYGIPTKLLDSIAIVESGRWDATSRASVAWPWTVMANGEGKFFPTKAEAVAEVKRLKARGVRNIDVGCMQVNLGYHPDAFSGLEDAFEPASNVGYAARFLKGLYGATQHWPTAASYYHSQTPKLAAEYRDKLMKVWNGSGRAAAAPPTAKLKPSMAPPRDAAAANRDEARHIADAYRQARLAEYQLRRARMIQNRRAAARS